MDVKRPYFWCIVPMCTNTSIKTPQKVFISVPKQPKERKLWLRAVRRDPKKVSATSSLYCCEDHFDVSPYTIALHFNEFFNYKCNIF